MRVPEYIVRDTPTTGCGSVADSDGDVVTSRTGHFVDQVRAPPDWSGTWSGTDGAQGAPDGVLSAPDGFPDAFLGAQVGVRDAPDGVRCVQDQIRRRRTGF